MFDFPPSRWILRPTRVALPDGALPAARIVTIPTPIAFVLLWPIWLVLHIFALALLERYDW